MNTINRKGYQIKALAESAEILIYDEIGESWIGGISAKQFATDLKDLKKVKDINVRINSEGGSVFEGHAIFNALRNHSARITVDIDGLAASIASIIAMAGDEIRMAENAFIMIHDPWMVAAGTAEDLRSQAEVMDKVQEKLVNTYVKRTNGDAEQIAAWMRDETWMNAEEALERGFVDSIVEETRMAACVRHKDRYKHTPENLIEPARPLSENQTAPTYMAAGLRAQNL
jgi:ATP-dependent Clp protease protease subunit